MKLKDAVRREGPGYRNPARYRLDFIKENTFNRVWSVRMTRARVFLVSAAIIAGGAALLWVIIAYTPVRQLLPGALKGDLRAQYIDAAVKLDSLEQAAARNAAYIANISSLMRGEPLQPDTAAAPVVTVEDSLLAASESERDFVRRYESQERFNLSVLAPIAAEGMVFSAPAGPTAQITHMQSKGMRISGPKATPLSAIYRGTVIAVTTGADGTSTVTVQHPNDFVSIYSGIADVFVDRGQRVEPGQRLGHLGTSPANFELWHKGSSLDPGDYINF